MINCEFVEVTKGEVFTRDCRGIYPLVAPSDFVAVYALDKRIPAGSELFIEYGASYWYFQNRVNSQGESVAFGLGVDERNERIKEEFGKMDGPVNKRARKVAEKLNVHYETVKKLVEPKKVKVARNQSILEEVEKGMLTQ